VREWLIENNFQGKEGQQVPEISDAKIEEISNRYIELFEKITGEAFQKGDVSNLLPRISANVSAFLQK
jgi:phosphoribosylaminoimidazole-succinocarboxamide synthase